MTQIFGDYFQELPDEEEYLTLSFLPRFFNYKYWKQNKLSANFIADYFQTFFISQEEKEGDEVDNVKIDNITNAIKYIANELLENAMKFQDSAAQFTARLKLSLSNDKVVFYVTNSINAPQLESFQTFIKQLMNEYPHELYIQRMMANAREKNSTRSGLGLLSMICVYSAQLGWKFETLETEPPVVVVNTMVCLSAKEVMSKIKKS